MVNMHVSDLPERSQDYLKAIFDLQEWGNSGVSLSELAVHLDQRTSTASEAIKRLAKQGLVEHRPYGDIQLTDTGRALAIAMVRRHRLIETFLSAHLGYSMDEVHAEAEVLEHAVSEMFLERIDSLMGRPRRDPHGDPIPDQAGAVPSSSVISLSDATTGDIVYVDRVSDRDPSLLRYLSQRAILPGVQLEVLAPAFADMAEFRVAGEHTVQLPAASLSAILVSTQPPAEDLAGRTNAGKSAAAHATAKTTNKTSGGAPNVKKQSHASGKVATS